MRPGLVLMTKPFEHVLGLIPKGVLAGLFVSAVSWYRRSALIPTCLVVHGNGCALIVRRDGEDALSHPGQKIDYTNRSTQSGPKIADCAFHPCRAPRFWRDFCHHSGESQVATTVKWAHVISDHRSNRFPHPHHPPCTHTNFHCAAIRVLQGRIRYLRWASRQSFCQRSFPLHLSNADGYSCVDYGICRWIIVMVHSEPRS